ncbi:BICD family-like cargo adapter 2 [Sphaerodactylus townsendi]|uniref:BICD family-like cargo adapter 2 n=1 Tax=Sphaerodactylus townsendi TaxID=933632 RepID=UPI002025E45A|nr:BICD family-like cargo adapter 2 [Sphaerodactylus townsendi]
MATTTASSVYSEEETHRTPFPLTPPVLGDEFYPFGGERRQSFVGDVVVGDGNPEDADLSILLQRKEQDLLLAAELGKMLLERNEELGRGFEELTKEHTEALERLEQEKHELRRRLESGQAEFETRVTELETDLAAARAQLGQQRLEQRDTNRESSQAVLDMSEQNQRLVEQLSQVSQLEQHLREELSLLRGENRTLSLSSAEHAARTQSLQAENLLLQEWKQDLEKQTRQLREENESVQALVDTLHDNLLLLRRESHEKELRMQLLEAETEELRASNRHLHLQVKEMKEEIRLHDADTSVTSIQSEIGSSLEDAPGAPGQTPKLMVNGTSKASPAAAAPKNPARRSEEEEAEYAKRVLALSYQGQDILKQKEIEIMKLQDQVTLQYVELNSLKSEIENQRRLYQESKRDEALKLAILDRDEAIIKKGEMELELAKVSLERDSMSQQLLRVIRQKMALSQELEAWQDDIQYIIHQQLLQKQQEWTHPISQSPKSPTQGKNPPFFQRGASIPNGTGFFSLFRKS